MTVLGLDLGISSVGWAYIENDVKKFQLKGWGSRIFEPGMEDDIQSGKGVSRCATRRLKSALRVQYRRRRARKMKMIQVLQENDFLPTPLTPDFFTTINNKLLLTFPLALRRQVAHVLPYLFRKKALDTPMEKYELGRAIYHLAQRRGYLSNRKKDLKNADMGIVQGAINQLKTEMALVHARTLGEYFSMIDPEEERIRTRYTERAMFQDEFHKICEAQRKNISVALEKELFDAIFFQRKLKSCKNLIGKCSFYPELPRCSYLKEEAQLFRIYTTVNHLRIERKGEIRSLTEDERKKTISVLNGFSDIFTQKGTVALQKLAKAIPLAKGEKFTLADEEKEIYGNQLHAILYRVFGDKSSTMPHEEREKFINDISSIEKAEVLKKRLLGYWKLSEEVAEKTLLLAYPDDRCAYSLRALKELLPDLEAGVPLATIKKLNHPDPVSHPCDLLPMLDGENCRIDLRNPLVHRVLTELRHVVNEIIKRYGKPDLIRIELARDLKNSNKDRARITQQNREREKERAKIAERIAKEAGIENPSRNDILKVMLAEECNFTCPYSGKSFSMTDLLHGGTIHIEHIIPFSRSFDDSFRNKTLCESSENAKKGNRTPFEAYSGKQYEDILERVSHFKGSFSESKKELFMQEEVVEQDFLNRSLNDTRYASKLAQQYLAMLYGGVIDATGKQRIFAVSGGCTALVRRSWGGNFLLGEGEKVRDDHRHHAVDALTIALTAPELVRTVAQMTFSERMAMKEKNYFNDNPIFAQASQMLDSATVSHHVTNKMRGALHNETIYSKDFGNTERHVRVALPELTAKEVANIIDPAIKKAVLAKLGIDDEKDVTDAALAIFKSSENLPSLCKRNGSAVNTIKSVRVRQNVATRTLGKGDRAKAVKNSSNYLLAVHAEVDANGNEIAWQGEIVTLLDAVTRKKHGEPLFERNCPGLKFKFTLQKGDIVRFTKDGKDWLCIVRGVSLPQFSLTPVKDARKQQLLKQGKVWFTPYVSTAFQWKMQKYTMNIFGDLRIAND